MSNRKQLKLFNHTATLHWCYTSCITVDCLSIKEQTVNLTTVNLTVPSEAYLL